MEAQKTKETPGMIVKSVPMDQSMITKIHRLMANHLERADVQLSFGEAARRLIQAGLERQEKTG